LHRKKIETILVLSHKLLEFVIDNYHFTKCTNYKCKAIFPLKLTEISKEGQQFCPKCKAAMLNSHIVQCENCQTILKFITKFPNEEDIVFYVDKCSSCSGTIKDEKLLTPHYFPESFI
jgi:hypothetical protein